jgi:hypothetical protein
MKPVKKIWVQKKKGDVLAKSEDKEPASKEQDGEDKGPMLKTLNGCFLCPSLERACSTFFEIISKRYD